MVFAVAKARGKDIDGSLCEESRIDSSLIEQLNSPVAKRGPELANITRYW
jgi:hypothetical protein